jgi:phosphopantothenoylcysteine decarboxylase/phosphopantothenate--cysteine ligase
MALAGKRVLLVIGGGIAAYKSLELIRRLKQRGALVRVIMTRAAQEFITPLSVGAIAGERAFTDLFDPASEFDIGHIRLAREPDFIVVAPATADLIAKMARGQADDLASTVLLASDKRVLIAPAMNPVMWEHPATRRNIAQVLADGILAIGPNKGEMAEQGEAGLGRMADPNEIIAAIEASLSALPDKNALSGKRVLVTSGPTREPIDPVRFLTNRSSGRQGHAVARAAARAGAEVVLVSGPVELPDPTGVKTVHVETAAEMLAAAEAALPVDAAICAAAVADWRSAEKSPQKLKKGNGKAVTLSLVENPDVLATLARHQRRPRLVVGFAAETEKILDHARAKLKAKGCDWILANDVSPASGVLGGPSNTIHLVTAEGVESWPTQSKQSIADGLVSRIAAALNGAGARK